MLEDAMNWYASLLQSILERENHPDMAHARQLASLDQCAWQRERRERKLQVKKRLAEGRRLADERNTSKRKFKDMSATEQQVLEEFDTHKLCEEHAEACAKRLPRFRGKLL